jgi:hypothetical protein
MKNVILVLAVFAYAGSAMAAGDSVFLYNPNYSSQGTWLLSANADDADENKFVPSSVESGGITHFGDTMGPNPYLGLPKDPNTPLIGDINGDGIDDIALLGDDGTGRDAVLVKFTGSIDEEGNITLTKPSPGGHIAHGMKVNADHKVKFLADVNGDGFDDVICRSTDNGYWVAYNSNPDGSGLAQGPDTWRSGNNMNNTLFKGDFNGDGVMDVAEHEADGTGGYLILSWLSVPGTGFVNTNPGVYAWTPGQTERNDLAAVLSADVDGDGMDDLVEIFDQTTTWLVRIMLSRVGGPTPAGVDFGGNYAWVTLNKNVLSSGICDIIPMIGDVNDDGFADLIFYDEFIHIDNMPHGRIKVVYGDGNVPNLAEYSAWKQTSNIEWGYYGYYGVFGQDFRGFIPMIGNAHAAFRATESDINADGVVDMSDFSWVASNWLKSVN